MPPTALPHVIEGEEMEMEKSDARLPFHTLVKL
jgi:hypothetical protein